MESEFKFEQILDGAKTVGISGHVRPDGDCIGACLGLWMYIRGSFPGIAATVYLQDIPEKFMFLDGAGSICHDPEGEEAPDVFFIIDCSEYERLGEFGNLARNAKKRACIDHHVTGKRRAEYNFIDPLASSASELVCRLLDEKCITRQMAEAFYTGISHDTGMFRYSNTSSATMRMAGMLMDKGIDFSKIAADTFYTKTYRQKQILGRALLESLRLMDGKVIFTSIRLKDMAFYGISSADLDGIVPELMSTAGVETAIFLCETGNLTWKVSLRSSDRVDVSAIAARFGGGGHKKAAGCRMQGTVYDVINNLTEQISLQLGD